jgi:hypothetical protein
MLWNGSEEDANVRSECEEEEGPDCDNRKSDIVWQRWIECDMLRVLSV